MSKKPYFWVIGGGLLQVPLIEEVRRLGFRVLVTDGSENCVCRPLADFFRLIDIFDVSAHRELAKNLIKEGEEIAGVLAAGIDAPETMAAVARDLGQPGVDPEIAHLVNNKDKFREALQKLGYPTPRFRVVDASNFHQLESLLSEVGFPLIVKNTNSSGSRGTRIFRTKDLGLIRQTLEEAMRVSRGGRALIEEVWEGPEQTVETIFDANGRFYPCFITDRIFDKSEGYAMEIGLRQPSDLPKNTQQEMFDLAERVARDLGIRIGAAKYDMILTAQGPRIIEMTVRLSGGFDCQYLVPAATGKNVLKAAILTALGKPFSEDLLLDKKGRVGLSQSIWPKPGRIVAIKGIEDAKRVPGFEHLFFRYSVGEVIAPYVDCTKRVCFILATGANAAEASQNMDKIKSLIQIETEPV